MFNLSEFGIDDFEANVVPATNKILSTSRSKDASFSFPYNPDIFVLHKISGCFNSVIQFSSKTCMRYFHNELKLKDHKWIHVSKLEYKELYKLLKSKKEPFVSTKINEFLLLKPSQAANIMLEIRAYFKPQTVKFIENNKLELEYHVQFILFKKMPKSPSPKVTQTIKYVNLDLLSLRISTTYKYQQEQNIKQVDVYADMTSATVGLQSPNEDLKWFLDNFYGKPVDTLLYPITGQSQIAIAPTISLVGQNDAKISVNEITQFQVNLFHVAGINGQALVVAFNIMPGIVGSVEKVQHFIGEEDYGVISDEYLIERLFKHKWNNGGFKRQIGWSASSQIEVTYDDGSTAMKDCDMYGSTELSTLDGITVETNSNYRKDCIRLSGIGRLVPSYIMVHLEDGDQYVDPGSAGINVGDLDNKPWAVDMLPTIEQQPLDDPEFELFLKQASQDAFRHLAMPFANNRRVSPKYIRTEAISEQVFVLGSLNIPLSLSI